MNDFAINIGSDLEAFSLSQTGSSLATLIGQSAALPST
jgi:hypothetical protein